MTPIFKKTKLPLKKMRASVKGPLLLTVLTNDPLFFILTERHRGLLRTPCHFQCTRPPPPPGNAEFALDPLWTNRGYRLEQAWEVTHSVFHMGGGGAETGAAYREWLHCSS